MKSNIVSLLLVLAAGQTPKAVAQSPGTFAATGGMASRRFLHSATLLTNGRVLIAGGTAIEGTTFKTLSGAELYEPTSGTFSATGAMTTPRNGHTATLLPDGKILIAGGGIADDNHLAQPVLASAELYDPNTGTFSATGAMTVARWYSTATLLNTGKVLIAGGLLAGGPLGDSAELYDPSTGTFTATGNMTGQWADTATLLPTGKVLITRGNSNVGPYLSSADLYDPSTGKFAPAGYLTTNHTGPTAVLLTNGKVLVAGGDVGDGDGASVRAEVYDPTTGVFSGLGNMTAGREQHSATLLSDGSVLFAGGHNVLSLASSAEIYDPIKGAFGRTASLHTARELHTATLLGDGRVLIAGGDDQRYWIPETILSTAELYTPAVDVPAAALLSLAQGQGAILHTGTPRVVSASDPAGAGDALEIYGTGLIDGGVIPPQVSIGGRMAEVLWFGVTPRYLGLNQINVRVPNGVTPGSAVPVRMIYLGRPSQEVTIGVR